MRCVNCNRRKAVLDVRTNEFLCKYCSKELDKEYKEPEELNGFSLLIVFLVMRIPILSSLITLLVCTNETEYKYRKAVAYNYVAHVILAIVFIFITGIKADEKQDMLFNALINKTLASNVTTLERDVNLDALIAEVTSKRDNYQKPTVIEVEGITPSEVIYLQDVIVEYSKAKSLIEMLYNSNYVVLVQTKETKSKYGKNSYYNVGVIITSEDSTKVKEPIKCEFVNGNKIPSYINEDEEVRLIEPDKLFTTNKFVYSMKKNEQYKLNLLYDDSDNFTGISFTAMED